MSDADDNDDWMMTGLMIDARNRNQRKMSLGKWIFNLLNGKKYEKDQKVDGEKNPYFWLIWIRTQIVSKWKKERKYSTIHQISEYDLWKWLFQISIVMNKFKRKKLRKKLLHFFPVITGNYSENNEIAKQNRFF